MVREHRLAERRHAVLLAVQQTGQISVLELSDQFDVSEVTIRSDLQALQEQGLLLRTRGGALATTSLPELSYDIRKQQQADKKTRIGRAAAALLGDGDVLALDASTTAQAVIPHISQLSELTVYSNGLKTTLSLLSLPQVQVYLPGGRLRRESISLVGDGQPPALEEIHLRIGFFGGRGLTVLEGLTDVNLDEVKTKRALAQRCQQVVVLVDARKWGEFATATVASLNQIDMIITDLDAPAPLVEMARDSGVTVKLV